MKLIKKLIEVLVNILRLRAASVIFNANIYSTCFGRTARSSVGGSGTML
jgi:hypothetical protein